MRLYRTGSVGKSEIWDRKRSYCRVENCGRRADSRGLCLKHRRRMDKGGSTDYVSAPQTGEANPEWMGDEVGYTAAHDRVKRRFGASSTYLCHGCGESAARQWAYDHADGATERRTERGYAYSPNPDHYLPMCVPCHRRMDLALRAARALTHAHGVQDDVTESHVLGREAAS